MDEKFTKLRSALSSDLRVRQLIDCISRPEDLLDIWALLEVWDESDTIAQSQRQQEEASRQQEMINEKIERDIE